VAPSSSVVGLIKELYALRQRGGITDAEARWILEIVLPVYGLTLSDLARIAKTHSP
jgi:hypothetical protein